MPLHASAHLHGGSAFRTSTELNSSVAPESGSGPPHPADSATGRDTLTFTLDPIWLAWRVLLVCVVLEILFVFLDYHVNYGRYTEIGAIRRLFNIAREDGLASWFGTAQTMLSALTLWGIYLVVRQRDAVSWTRFGWLGLALFFSYMAVDDGAQIHERMGTVFQVMRERSDPTAVPFFPSYAWQVVFAPAFALIGIAALVFLWRELPLLAQRLAVLAALGCLAVAVGLDFFEGLEPDHPLNAYAYFGDSVAINDWALRRFNREAYQVLDHFSRSVEESLEMLANSVFWATFLSYFLFAARELRVRFATNSSVR